MELDQDPFIASSCILGAVVHLVVAAPTTASSTATGYIPRRRPLILFADTFLNPTGAASLTPSSTLPEPLRRHHRQPYRSSFAYTILNPTGAALPTHKSTALDPLPRTLIQPTGAASDAPSMAADPHRRHHP